MTVTAETARRTGSMVESVVLAATDGDRLLRVLSARGLLSPVHCTYASASERRIWIGAFATLTVTADTLTWAPPGGREITEATGSRPFAQAGAHLDGMQLDDWRGWGVSAFELAYVAAGQRPPASSSPLMSFVVPESELHVRRGEVRIRSLSPSALATLRAAVLAAGDAPPLDAAPNPLPVDDGRGDRYRAAVHHARDAIRRGELHKVVLSRRLAIPFEVDLLSTYLLASRGNTPARSFLLAAPGGIEAAGFSPELVCAVDGQGRVTTQPLAGTRASGSRAHAQLRRDPKERFEHAISVEESYAQMTEVCEPETVAVCEPTRVVTRGPVLHLASRLEGRLAARRTSWDALDILFPAVTATGVSRHGALEQIRRLEFDGPRGLYGGAVWVAGADGSVEAALALRSLFRSGARGWLQAGAGIVADSTPEREWTETCEKLSCVAPYVVETSSERTPPLW